MYFWIGGAHPCQSTWNWIKTCFELIENSHLTNPIQSDIEKKRYPHAPIQHLKIHI